MLGMQGPLMLDHALLELGTEIDTVGIGTRVSTLNSLEWEALGSSLLLIFRKPCFQTGMVLLISNSDNHDIHELEC